MPRKLALLVTATAIAVTGGVLGASSASAANDGPNPHSQHGQCTAAASGLHRGWDKQANNERRNVGGACPAQP
jgi:pyruvate/2-oxoacid:ferredoxin oxidoreductase beta subunit